MNIYDTLVRENLIIGFSQWDVKGFLARWETELQMFHNFNYDPICPYHNLSHLIGVAMLVEDMMKGWNIEPDIRIGILAALYHDFNYRGKRDDHLNVISSVNDFKSNYRTNVETKNLVSNIIFLTKWPHEPIPEYQLHLKKFVDIVRDADLLYSTVFCSKEMINRLYLALGYKCGTYTLEDFVKRNRNFIENQTPFTEKGKELLQAHLNTAICYHIDMGH